MVETLTHERRNGRRKIQKRAQKVSRERVAPKLMAAPTHTEADTTQESAKLSLAAVQCAGYIAELITELGALASYHHLDILAYLLKMAEFEATSIMRLNSADLAKGEVAQEGLTDSLQEDLQEDLQEYLQEYLKEYLKEDLQDKEQQSALPQHEAQVPFDHEH